MNVSISNEAAKARQEYHREWRRKNKQRIQKYNEQYWERKALKNKIQYKVEKG